MEKCFFNTTSLDVHVIEEELKERPFRAWTKENSLFDYNKTTALAMSCSLYMEKFMKNSFRKKRGMMGDMHNMDYVFLGERELIFQIETKISRINGKMMEASIFSIASKIENYWCRRGI